MNDSSLKMNSPSFPEDAGKAGHSGLSLVSISQHCFGFVHGFVFCLVLKHLNKTASGGEWSPLHESFSTSSAPAQAQLHSSTSCLSTTEVKEEIASDFHSHDFEHTIFDSSNSDFALNKACKFQTECTKPDGDHQSEKAAAPSMFYLHVTDIEHESNGNVNSDKEEWTDACDYEDQDSPSAYAQSLTISNNCKQRKRRQSKNVQVKNSGHKKSRRRLTVQKSETDYPQQTTVVAQTSSNVHKTTAGETTTEPSAATQVYTCEKCDKTFTTARSCKRHSLKVHLRSREGSTKRTTEKLLKAQCDKCPKMYTGGRAEKNLRQHVLAYHSEVEPVQCDVCNITLNNQHHLKLHKRSSHRKDVCYICGAHFVTQIGLQTHLLAHKGDKSFVCEICGAAFVRVSSLRQHTKFHTDSRDFQCGKCPLSFKTFSSLSIHMMCVHQCGGYFNSQVQKLAKLSYMIDKDSLQRLQNQQCVTCGQELVNMICPSHSADCMISFSCPQCQWTTKDIQKFRKHLVRRNSATLCSGTGETKTSKSCAGLMEKNRPLVKNFICPSCGKRFYTQSHLQAHKHQHAEKRFSCPVCGKGFTYKFNMQNHLTTHTDARPFECQVCQKTFKMKSQLQLHQRYHDGEFKCEICGKILTRKQHVINHYKLVHPEKKLTD